MKLPYIETGQCGGSSPHEAHWVTLGQPLMLRLAYHTGRIPCKRKEVGGYQCSLPGCLNIQIERRRVIPIGGEEAQVGHYRRLALEREAILSLALGQVQV